MDELINQIKQFANLENSNVVYIKKGIIRHYDPTVYAAKVEIVPEEIESNWLPIFSPWVGNGWGMICPPSVGDMCEIHFEDGAIDNGVICLRGYSKIQPPPQDEDITQPGSFLLKSKSGTLIKILKTGELKIETAAGQKITIKSDDEIDIGDSGETFYKLVTETFKDFYNVHEHTGPNQPPTVPMDDTKLTTVLRGN